MDYNEPDFWSTSAQLLIILWLIMAVETKPTIAETARYRKLVEKSQLRKIFYYFFAMMVVVVGVFSLVILVYAVVILSGLAEPTLTLAGMTAIAIGGLGISAMFALVQTVIKTSGLIKSDAD